MKPSIRKAVTLTSDILLSVMLVISAVLLCLACLSIYSSADTQMFTYERIALEWSRIKIPIYLTLILIALRAAAACVETLLSAEKKEKLSLHRSRKAELKRLYLRIDSGSISNEAMLAVKGEKKLRFILKTVNIILCSASALLPLIYIADPERYLGTTSAEVTEEVLSCFIIYIVCLIPSAVFLLIYARLNDRSLEREAEILKNAATSNTNQNTSFGNTLQDRHDKITVLSRLALLTIAVVFIIIGSLNGGMEDVLKKAAEICAECIGLG